jgi:hypothetical protein
MPHRHDDDRYNGHGEKIGDHSVRCESVKVIRSIWGRREPCDQRRQNQRRDFTSAPQGYTPAKRAISIGVQRKAVLIGCDQCQCRSK